MSTSKVSQDLLIGFSEDATPSFDRSLDAYKVRGNSSIQFYSRLEDRQMAIQALPLLEEEKSVALGFDVLESNDYQLSISGSGHFESDILLQDHLLNKEVLLSDMEGYSFSSEESVDSDRFSLVFAPNNTLTLPVDPEMNDWFVYVEGNKLYLKSNAMISEATVMIYDLGGHIIKQFNGVSISSDEWALDFQPKGMFVMAVQYDKGLLIKKFIK